MKDNNETFQRWQSITLDQMTYTINLILSFSVASLAFVLTHIQKESNILLGREKVLLFVSALVFMLSILIGLFAVVNRLIDFRLTMQISKERDEAQTDKKIANKISIKKKCSKKRGKATWLLLYLQVGSFGLGIVIISIQYFIFFS